jgi:hypothetical protein
MTTTTRNKYTNDGTSKEDTYKDFKKENPNMSLSREAYFDIVEKVHRKVFDVICERDYAVRISHSIGSFHIKCYVPKSENRPIDLKKSKELNTVIYFKNSHSDGKRFKVIRNFSNIYFSLNTIFRFKMCRKLSREMAQKIFKKEIPSWT